MTGLIITKIAEKYVSNLFLEANTSGLFYHDFNHTLSIVEAVISIAKALKLTAEEKNILTVAAWFHDTGYLYTRNEHEALSCKIAQRALTPNFPDIIDTVNACIAATKVEQIPQSDLAALLKDADVAFGSAYDFQKTNYAYREELRISERRVFDDETWYQMSLHFLETVTFYSPYGQQYLAPLAQQNLEKYRALKASI